MIVAVWPWGAYLGEEGKRDGIRAKVSSWRRISPDSLIPHAKASGQYLNSILAKTEAAKAGYDEAILLDQRGMVCEGSGENIFLVREGEMVTPPAHGLDPRRDQPQVGDPDRRGPRLHRGRARHRALRAVPGRGGFLTGTAAELVPVREIDDHDLGEPGEITGCSRPSTRMRCTGEPRSTSSGWTSWSNRVKSPMRRDRARRLFEAIGRISGAAAA